MQPRCFCCSMSNEGFSLSLPPSAFLHPSLCPERVPHLWPLWWCFSAQNGFTSTKTSLLYLYFTTPLGNRASWARRALGTQKRERGQQKNKKVKSRRRRRKRRDSKMGGGWGFNNVNNKEQNKEKGFLNKEWGKRNERAGGSDGRPCGGVGERRAERAAWNELWH